MQFILDQSIETAGTLSLTGLPEQLELLLVLLLADHVLLFLPLEQQLRQVLLFLADQTAVTADAQSLASPEGIHVSHVCLLDWFRLKFGESGLGCPEVGSGGPINLNGVTLLELVDSLCADLYFLLHSVLILILIFDLI